MCQKFVKVIFIISKHHDGKVFVKRLHKLEKVHFKKDKGSLDLNFSLNCKTFGIVPKVHCFSLPCTNHNDPKAIWQSLLRSSTFKRANEKHKLSNYLQEITKDAKIVVTRIEWLGFYSYILEFIDNRCHFIWLQLSGGKLICFVSIPLFKYSITFLRVL